jgi:hypothetical protein
MARFRLEQFELPVWPLPISNLQDIHIPKAHLQLDRDDHLEDRLVLIA